MGSITPKTVIHYTTVVIKFNIDISYHLFQNLCHIQQTPQQTLKGWNIDVRT